VSYPTGNYIYSSPAIGADGTVYVGSVDSYLYALTLTARPNGRTPLGACGNRHRAVASPWPDQTIYVGSYDWALYAIKLTASEVAIPCRFGRERPGSHRTDGTIYFGTGDSNDGGGTKDGYVYRSRRTDP